MYGAITLFGRTFQTVLLTLSYNLFAHSPDPSFEEPRESVVVLQPQTLLANHLVWAVPRSLATTSGISVDFSSSGY